MAVKQHAIAVVKHGLISILLVEADHVSKDSLRNALRAASPSSVPHAVRFKPAAVVVVFTQQLQADDPEVIAAVDRIANILPNAPRLMVTQRSDVPPTVYDAVQRGWRGVIEANFDLDTMIAAIQLLSAGGTYLPPAVIENWTNNK